MATVNAPEMEFAGKKYPLATTLRVAYKLQNCNNHKPYLDIFSTIDKLPIEKQIQFLWISFSLANHQAASALNPQVALTETEFTNWCLDNLGLRQILSYLSVIVNEIMYQGLPEDKKKPLDLDKMWEEQDQKLETASME